MPEKMDWWSQMPMSLCARQCTCKPLTGQVRAVHGLWVVGTCIGERNVALSCAHCLLMSLLALSCCGTHLSTQELIIITSCVQHTMQSDVHIT